MSEIAINCLNLGKKYRIGKGSPRYATLRDTLAGAARAPLRRFIRSNGANSNNSIWALREVSFQIPHGEVVGVIGRNGAGKSTLLKILSRITRPSKGTATIEGRVGSLLEVGTGFHPELTGRENIFLNGAILGMRRDEILRKFDEIVAFAEVEKFIDTPVKHYSSGMYMRLAFAVAAHLETEILLVDEVLAVGDAAFQQKCLGKMSEVAKQGRTIMFVSHNMTAINQLCPRAMLLNDGRLEHIGPTNEVVTDYLKSGADSEQVWDDQTRAPGNDRIKLRAVRVVSEGVRKSEVNIDQEVAIEVDFWNRHPGLKNVCVNIYLLDGLGNVVLSTGTTPAANSLREDWYDRPHPVGLFRARCTLPANFLNDGLYHVTVYIMSLGPMMIEVDAPQVLSFNVFDTGVMREPGGGTGKWVGAVRVKLPWQTDFLGSEHPTQLPG